MRALLTIAAVLAANPAPNAPGNEQARPSKPVPVLAKDPKVDGALKDLAPAAKVAPTCDKCTASWSASAAFRKDTLYLGVDVTDDKLTSGDLLEIMLAFPDAGTTARGFTYRFGFDGKRAPDPEAGPPAFADALVQSAVQKHANGFSVEVGLPPRALPRFPAKGPLAFDLCITYEDRDEAGEPVKVTNCPDGATKDVALRLPDDVRRLVKGKPPDAVEGLEARENGWVGFGALHFPLWVLGDADLTAGALARMATEEPLDPKEVHINLPNNLSLKDGRPLVGVLSGKDPYSPDGQCNMELEGIRVALYAVKGKVGDRVLEWPAASCALGRAISFVMNDEGGLAVGYSNGSTVTFSWSNDHFERTEFGAK